MVRFSFRGNVRNEEVLKFYQENQVDCFVSTSEAEGLPVSVMEAEGAGIPVIAMNVGGVKEMIDQNGILLDPDSSPETIAESIVSIVKQTPDTFQRMRTRSRSIWEQKFDAAFNAKLFADDISNVKTEPFKRIILVTEGYPFLLYEKSFLFAELKELLKHYKVTILACIEYYDSTIKNENAKEEISDLLGASIDSDQIELFCYSREKYMIELLPYFFSYFVDCRVRRERKEIFSEKHKRKIRLWESIKYYARACRFFAWFKDLGLVEKEEKGSVLLYTYWNLSPTLGLCLNRHKLGDVKIITRAHGYDYQDEQWEKSLRKPFVTTTDAIIDRVFFVCSNGIDYYVKKNHLEYDKTKYLCRYLGSRDPQKVKFVHEEDDLETNNKERFRLVSCSSLISLKRVGLIIDALSVIHNKYKDIDIEWIHFGDGILKQELMEYASTKLEMN